MDLLIIHDVLNVIYTIATISCLLMYTSLSDSLPGLALVILHLWNAGYCRWNPYDLDAERARTQNCFKGVCYQYRHKYYCSRLCQPKSLLQTGSDTKAVLSTFTNYGCVSRVHPKCRYACVSLYFFFVESFVGWLVDVKIFME